MVPCQRESLGRRRRYNVICIRRRFEKIYRTFWTNMNDDQIIVLTKVIEVMVQNTRDELKKLGFIGDNNEKNHRD